jgi:DNA-binding MarR family transcriptional regulator
VIPRGALSRPALLLVKLGDEILVRGEAALAELGLTGRQYTILAVLSSDKPPSQSELAGVCGLLPAQVVPVIDELERRGLVERKRSETDRRRSVVALTPAGTEALEQGDALADRLVAEIDDEVRQAAVDALSRSYNTAG